MIDWPALLTAIAAAAGVLIAWDARKTANERRAEMQHRLSEMQHERAAAGQAAAESADLLLGHLNNRVTELAAKVEQLTANEQHLREERELREQSHKAELDTMRTVQAAMQNELDELRAGVGVLVAQLEQANITPRYRPKPGSVTGA